MVPGPDAACKRGTLPPRSAPRQPPTGVGASAALSSRASVARSTDPRGRDYREALHVTEMLVVFTTFAREEDAARVVRTLVEERLAACGNLLPGARSLYRWQGAVADEREVVAILKTRKQDWSALLSRLHELHPYDTPECIAVRVAAGAPKYLAWLEQSLEPDPS